MKKCLFLIIVLYNPRTCIIVVKAVWFTDVESKCICKYVSIIFKCFDVSACSSVQLYAQSSVSQ